MIHDVPLVPQTTSMGCWAASIAMILGWRRQQSIADVTIAANAGGTNYMPSMTGNGLDPNDRYILRRNGFLMDEPMCYTLDLVKSRIDSYGPLWVASAVPSAHIRVVCGYEGDMLQINDPAPVDTGSRYRSSFGRFFGRMEALGARERGEPAPIYVAYLSPDA